MSTQAIGTGAADPNWKRMYRAGGISAIVFGISYIIIIILYALGGPLPAGAEEWLKHLAGNTASWWAILGLSVLTDILLVMVALSLYLALKEVNRNAMLLGAGLLVMFVILDLAVTWPNYAALITLSGYYLSAAGQSQQALIVAAASYPYAVLESSLFAFYAILLPSLGLLIIGFVMLKGAFNKLTAYAGIFSGILGIISVLGPFFIESLGVVVVFSSILMTAWALLLGFRLYRLGQR